MVDAVKEDPFALNAGVPGITGSLRPKPKFTDRISKRVLLVAFAVIALVLGLFFAALDAMDNTKRPATEQKKDAAQRGSGKEPELANPLDDKAGGAKKSEKDKVPASLVAPPVPEPASVVSVAPAPVASPATAMKGVRKGAAAAVAPEVPAIGDESLPAGIPREHSMDGGLARLTPEQQTRELAKAERRARMAKAREGGMSAKAFGTSDVTAPAPSSTAGAMASLLAAAKEGGLGALGGAAIAGPAKPPGEQEEKMDFLKTAAKEDRGYHPHVAQRALSENEIKTGAFIPMALESSINSDLPGQITARVTEDVYDTMSGCKLLVPAMAKVVGRYDSKVALGQGRMLVVWNALIFPDGSELNMAAMQGYDTAGQAGLDSDVDNHYWRLFGMTFGLSMVTAGVQISVPQPNPTTNGAAAPQTPSQIVASALAQQYGSLGAQILGKYMAVQPTLRNAAGERFVVMVPHTIVFTKVWRTRCMVK